MSMVFRWGKLLLESIQQYPTEEIFQKKFLKHENLKDVVFYQLAIKYFKQMNDEIKRQL